MAYQKLYSIFRADNLTEERKEYAGRNVYHKNRTDYLCISEAAYTTSLDLRPLTV